MPTLIAETRTFVGESATAIGDGYAGFRLGQPYQLTYERREDGTVALVLDHHAHVSEGAGPMVVTGGQFEQWWVIK